jgi:hypothetical protein
MQKNRFYILSACLEFGLTGIAEGQQDKTARRVESVTWNPVEHKLTWTISEGVMNGGGKFEPKENATYEIKMDTALMSVQGEARRFSKAEAVSVHRLMDVISRYAAESTVWWEAGQGEPVDKDGKPKMNPDNPHRRSPGMEPRPRRVSDPEANTVTRIALRD